MGSTLKFWHGVFLAFAIIEGFLLCLLIVMNLLYHIEHGQGHLNYSDPEFFGTLGEIAVLALLAIATRPK